MASVLSHTGEIVRVSVGPWLFGLHPPPVFYAPRRPKKSPAAAARARVGLRPSRRAAQRKAEVSAARLARIVARYP
ncbi:MAG: hypothetical protein O7E49_09690, partial [Gemmatimonadetes bacterium]|nr:hypothetical protein [Gemmatimonadota bacterium]